MTATHRHTAAAEAAVMADRAMEMDAKAVPRKCRRQKNGAKVFRSDFVLRSIVAVG